jgi:hypothetical protein
VYSVQLVSCPGPVLFSAVSVSRWSAQARCLSITDCGSVLLVDCSFIAGKASGSALEFCHGASVAVNRSRVTMQRCMVVGSSGADANELARFSSTPGQPGMAASASEVFLFQTECHGGYGEHGWLCSLAPSAGGSALTGAFGLIVNCKLVAGRGGWNSCSLASDGLALGGTFIPPLSAIRSPGKAMLGGTWMLTLTGVPGTILFTAIDAGHGHLPLPGIDGPFLLTPAFVPFVLVTVGSSGGTPWPLPVPLDPSLRGQFFFVQGVALAPGAVVPSLTPVGDVRLE